MSSERKNRIIKAIAQTESLLAKERAYLPENQNVKMIDWYQSHVVNLKKQLVEPITHDEACNYMTDFANMQS